MWREPRFMPPPENTHGSGDKGHQQEQGSAQKSHPLRTDMSKMVANAAPHQRACQASDSVILGPAPPLLLARLTRGSRWPAHRWVTCVQAARAAT